MSSAVIFDIKRFAVHDGDGIRTTVFFKGCPLRCLWCHNPEGLSARSQLSYQHSRCTGCGSCASVCPAGAHMLVKTPGGRFEHHIDRTRCSACGKCAEVCPGHALRVYGQEVTVDELLPVLLEDKEFYVQTGGGVTLSGGEALLQPKFCAELLAKLKKHGIHTAVDTCGAVAWSAVEQVIPYTDIFLYDLKAMDDALHRALTGTGNQDILDNLQKLDAHGKELEIRIPLIPGGNDGEIEKMGAFLRKLKHVRKVKVLPYHHFYVPKYGALGLEHALPETQPPDEQALHGAIACLRRFELNAVDGNE